MLDAGEAQDLVDSYTAPTSSMNGCVLTVTVPGFAGTAKQGEEYATTLADALGILDLRRPAGIPLRDEETT